jgi:hypothetical protein
MTQVSLRIPRCLPGLGPGPRGQVQLVVGQHRAAIQDLRGVVFEQQVRQVVDPDLELLADPDHLHQVGPRPGQPCQLAREGNAKQIQHRAVLAERDDVAGVAEREALFGQLAGAPDERTAHVHAHGDRRLRQLRLHAAVGSQRGGAVADHVHVLERLAIRAQRTQRIVHQHAAVAMVLHRQLTHDRRRGHAGRPHDGERFDPAPVGEHHRVRLPPHARPHPPAPARRAGPGRLDVARMRRARGGDEPVTGFDDGHAHV